MAQSRVISAQGLLILGTFRKQGRVCRLCRLPAKRERVVRPDGLYQPDCLQFFFQVGVKQRRGNQTGRAKNGFGYKHDGQ